MRATRHEADGLTVERFTLRRDGFMQVFAKVGRKAYEFTRLREDAQVEVYDFPARWDGVPRFVGYMPESTGAKLVAMVKDGVREATRCGASWAWETEYDGAAFTRARKLYARPVGRVA